MTCRHVHLNHAHMPFVNEFLCCRNKKKENNIFTPVVQDLKCCAILYYSILLCKHLLKLNVPTSTRRLGYNIICICNDEKLTNLVNGRPI